MYQNTLFSTTCTSLWPCQLVLLLCHCFRLLSLYSKWLIYTVHVHVGPIHAKLELSSTSVCKDTTQSKRPVVITVCYDPRLKLSKFNYRAVCLFCTKQQPVHIHVHGTSVSGICLLLVSTYSTCTLATHDCSGVFRHVQPTSTYVVTLAIYIDTHTNTLRGTHMSRLFMLTVLVHPH